MAEDTTQLPEPPVPADADLRGLQYMPLFGDRLFASRTWIAAKPEAKVAALRLWWHGFSKEVPAGSLPDDDTLLAEYAGYGVAIRSWLRVKQQAMRGWTKSADGRLYHSTVCEVVAAAWSERLRQREKQRKWREKNRNVTGNEDGDVTGNTTGYETGYATGDVTGVSPKEEKRKGRGREVNTPSPLPPSPTTRSDRSASAGRQAGVKSGEEPEAWQVDAIAELRARGVAKNLAFTLAEESGLCWVQIAELADQIGREPGVEKPAGLLVSRIREGQGAPVTAELLATRYTSRATYGGVPIKGWNSGGLALANGERVSRVDAKLVRRVA